MVQWLSPLPVQEAWVQSLIRELDPNAATNTHCSQLNKYFEKSFRNNSESWSTHHLLVRDTALAKSTEVEQRWALGQGRQWTVDLAGRPGAGWEPSSVVLGGRRFLTAPVGGRRGEGVPRSLATQGGWDPRAGHRVGLALPQASSSQAV